MTKREYGTRMAERDHGILLCPVFLSYTISTPMMEFLWGVHQTPPPMDLGPTLHLSEVQYLLRKSIL